MTNSSSKPQSPHRPENAQPSSSSQPPRLALVCDWLTTPGGAEKVLLELHRMYPDAPIYTSQYNRKKLTWFRDADVRTGWLQLFPSAFRKLLGPLRQRYFSHLDLSQYDVVISVTGAEAKSVKTVSKKSGHRAYHFCYCHVPTQYYWQMYDQYIENPGFGILNPLVRLAFQLLVKPLRKADYAAAQRPDQFITISSYAADQIKKYYNRESVIIAPPVEIARFTPGSSRSSVSPKAQKSPNSTVFSTQFSTKSSDFSTKTHQLSTRNPQQAPTFSTSFPQVFHSFIIACRQVTWKRVDLAIRACMIAKVPLLVVGDGPEHSRLVKLAGDSEFIKFLPWTPTDQLAAHLQNSSAFLFPSLEPFGIAAVEALAAGCPVIAYAEGGSRDFVEPGKNGLLFPEQTAFSLAAAIDVFDPRDYRAATVYQSAERFAPEYFRAKISQLVSDALRSDHA